MRVVDPVANLKVAIHRSAGQRGAREGRGVLAYAPAALLIIDLFDASGDLELAAGMLEDAGLLDAGAAQALISLHLHVSRASAGLRPGVGRFAVTRLLEPETITWLGRRVFDERGERTAVQRPVTTPGPVAEQATARSRTPWPAPVGVRALLPA